MVVLYLILYIIAAVCFAVEAFHTRGTVHTSKPYWLACGLFAWVLVPLLQTLDSVVA